MRDSQDNFDDVRRALALKRHETPPPGFFNTFADGVLERIRAEQEAVRESFWQRLVGGFELKPAFVGGCALVAGLVYFSVLTVQRTLPAKPGTGLAGQPATRSATPLLKLEPPPQEIFQLNPVTPAGYALDQRPAGTAAPPPWLFSPGAGLPGIGAHGLSPASAGAITSLTYGLPAGAELKSVGNERAPE